MLAVSRRSWYVGRRTQRRALNLFDCLSELVLDTPRQLVLPLSRDESVLAGHFQITVARNLRGLDGAATHLLPPGDVRPTERVRSESLKIASLCLGCLVKSIANTRVPERSRWCAPLVKDPGVRRGTVCLGPFAVAHRQIADSERSAAILALWACRCPDARRAARS